MSTSAPTPPTRSEVARDGLRAAVLALFLVIGTYGAARHNHSGLAIDALAIAILLGVAGALAFRRIRPVPVLWATWLLTLAYFVRGYPDGPVWIGLLVAYYTAVSRGHRAAAAAAAVAGFAVFPWLSDLTGRGRAPSLLALLALAAWLLVMFGLGEGVRMRRQRAAEAARIVQEEARTKAGEERLRIARDLHDVLAHNISLINVQAGVALHVNEGLPDQAAAALTAIKQASREALGELRSALDALRQNGEAPPRGPAPGLDRLDELVAGARAAGLDVRVEVEGDRVALPIPIDLAAYRLFQEALTNIIRHAGAAHAWIRVTYAGSELRLRVEDDGHGAPPGPATGGGTGIVGMRERVEALGGELRTGPRPGGGFQVAARVPLPASAETEA